MYVSSSNVDKIHVIFESINCDQDLNHTHIQCLDDLDI
jgi:hypothetical protein